MLRLSFISALTILLVSSSDLPAQMVPEHVKQFENWSVRAKRGDSFAQRMLAISYEIGRGVEKDNDAAVYWLRRAAEQGYAPAQVDLAQRYANGNGVPKDPYTAYAWLKIAAGIDPENQKYVDAIESRASAEFISMGRRRVLELKAPKASQEDTKPSQPKLDDAQLFWAIKKLAEDGNVNSQARLGECYAFGKGVAQDWDEAVYWWRKAADAGSAGAQFGLAVCYLEGNGVSKSEQKAFHWFQKAAIQGDAAAEFNVGLSYGSGRGVARDDSQAVIWLLKSAKQGFSDAQVCLAGHYNMGRGVDKDIIEAYAWICLASTENDMARQLRQRISSSMTPDLIELSQVRLAELSATVAASRKAKSK